MGEKYVGWLVTNESGGRLPKRDEGKERCYGCGQIDNKKEAGMCSHSFRSKTQIPA